MRNFEKGNNKRKRLYSRNCLKEKKAANNRFKRIKRPVMVCATRFARSRTNHASLVLPLKRMFYGRAYARPACFYEDARRPGATLSYMWEIQDTQNFPCM